MTDQAMIVKLSVRAWGATRTDKEVGEEVARQKGASPEAGKYVKNLIDRSALKEVRAAIQALRDRHKELTRPWDDDGRRLVPLGIMPQYQYEIDQLRADFTSAVEDFVREYPGLRDYAAMNLGQMFNEQDYPHENDIRDRFQAEVDYEPVPDGQHAPKGYEEEVDKAVRRRMKDSADELFHRIVNTLSEVNRKLKAHDERMEQGDKRGRFRLTVLEDLAELADLLPAMNIEHDPFLDGVAKRLKAELEQAGTPETLRDNDGHRKLVIADVDALIEDLQSREGSGGSPPFHP